MTGAFHYTLNPRCSATSAASIPPTLELVIIALILAVILGVPAGILAARLRGKLPDALVRLGSTLAVSMPIFWLALILQYVFFSTLHWLPVSGEYTPALDYTHPLTEYTGSTVVDSLVTGNWAVLGSSLSHLVLPVLAVAAYPAGIIAMMIRASLVETISEEHGPGRSALLVSESGPCSGALP